MKLPIHLFASDGSLAAVGAVSDVDTTNIYVLRIKGMPVNVPPKLAQKLHPVEAAGWCAKWLSKKETQDYDAPSRIAERVSRRGGNTKVQRKWRRERENSRRRSQIS